MPKNKNFLNLFSLQFSKDQLQLSLRTTASERLRWLESVNDFVSKAVPKKKFSLWSRLKEHRNR